MKKRCLFLNNPIFLEWNIKQLPPNLRNYLYIWCMKLFWRNYIPLTAKIPSWYNSYVIQQNNLLQARLKNIHFLHLPCNTLEENKNYILGCQCSYCKNYGIHNEGNVDIMKHILRQHYNHEYLSNSGYFNKCVPYTESIWNNLHEYIEYIDNIEFNYKKGMSVFNPGYDILINVNDIIHGKPIEFNEIDYS
jgi:hypothetical protein